MTWASELAAPALDAVHDVVVLHLVPHAVPCLFAEQPWFETHWTSAYALTAAHAVGDLLAETLCLWQEQQTAHALVAWHIDIAHRTPHHRPTADDFTVSSGTPPANATTSVNGVPKRTS